MSAEKVEGFPVGRRRGGVLKYPFAEIASDGGVWRLDPAEYDSNCRSMRHAAANWAKRYHLKYATEIHDGLLYVQFTKRDQNGRRP